MRGTGVKGWGEGGGTLAATPWGWSAVIALSLLWMCAVRYQMLAQPPSLPPSLIMLFEGGGQICKGQIVFTEATKLELRWKTINLESQLSSRIFVVCVYLKIFVQTFYLLENSMLMNRSMNTTSVLKISNSRAIESLIWPIYLMDLDRFIDRISCMNLGWVSTILFQEVIQPLYYCIVIN